MKKKTLVSAVLAATIMGTTSVSLAAENMWENYEKDMKTFSRHENMAWQVIAIIITVRGRINTEYDRLP